MKSINTPAYVYQYLDNLGNVIYVGSTFDYEKRDYEHKVSDKWYWQVSSFLIAETKSRTDALAIESHYISVLKPKHNKLQKEYGELSELPHIKWLTPEQYKVSLNNRVKREMMKAENILQYKPLERN